MTKRGNGEGSIYFSETKQKWVGQFTVGRKDNGKLDRKTVYGKTRKEVAEKINENLAKVQNNSYIYNSKLTLENIAKDNIEQQYNSNNIRVSTYQRKNETLKILQKLSISKMNVQDIEFVHINKALNSLKDYSNSSINKVYDLINNALDTAVLLKLKESNPCKLKGAIIKPKSNKEDNKIEALTVEEQRAFVNELKKGYDKYTDIYFVAIYTGMRIGEILALEKNDIDFNSKTININKTLTKIENYKIGIGDTKTYSGTRKIPMSDNINFILKRRCFNTTKYLFLDNGKFISNGTINTHFKKICKNAGIKVTTSKIIRKVSNRYKEINHKTSEVNTHMLRHTYATRCIESGMPPVVLQRILGHKDISITLNTYTSVFNELKVDEINKMEKYLEKIGI